MEPVITAMVFASGLFCGLRVLVQLHIMNEQEFHVTELSFRDREGGEVEV